MKKNLKLEAQVLFEKKHYVKIVKFISDSIRVDYRHQYFKENINAYFIMKIIFVCMITVLKHFTECSHGRLLIPFSPEKVLKQKRHFLS